MMTCVSTATGDVGNVEGRETQPRRNRNRGRDLSRGGLVARKRDDGAARRGRLVHEQGRRDRIPPVGPPRWADLREASAERSDRPGLSQAVRLSPPAVPVTETDAKSRTGARRDREAAVLFPAPGHDRRHLGQGRVAALESHGGAPAAAGTVRPTVPRSEVSADGDSGASGRSRTAERARPARIDPERVGVELTRRSRSRLDDDPVWPRDLRGRDREVAL